MPELGHFRPIQRGLAMSGYPPEAAVGTAGIYEYTPFCNGPDEVKPLMIVTSPSSSFCPWSTLRPPHYAVRGSGEPI
jgi:hypothetical protein